MSDNISLNDIMSEGMSIGSETNHFGGFDTPTPQYNYCKYFEAIMVAAVPAIIGSHLSKQWMADRLPFIGNLWGTPELSDD